MVISEREKNNSYGSLKRVRSQVLGVQINFFTFVHQIVFCVNIGFYGRCWPGSRFSSFVVQNPLFIVSNEFAEIELKIKAPN